MNDGNSKSKFISVSQCRNLIDACDFANRMDMRLTRSLDFNLKHSDMKPQQFVGAFTKLCCDWLYTKGAGRAFVWVLEAPPGKSLNLHMLVHVPPPLMPTFRRYENKWIRETGIGHQDRKFKRSRIVGDPNRRNYADTPEWEYVANLAFKLGYMLKGTSSSVRAKLQICHPAEQGIVYGKRCGTSESIGQAARDRAGYKAPVSARECRVIVGRHLLEAENG